MLPLDIASAARDGDSDVGMMVIRFSGDEQALYCVDLCACHGSGKVCRYNARSAGIDTGSCPGFFVCLFVFCLLSALLF